MTVRDIHLPDHVEKGVSGGHGFSTDLSTVLSGHEKRNANWARTRGEWDASYGVQHKDDLQAVIDLHFVSFGMTYGFRFKDWWDFEVGTVAVPQALLPVGDGIEVDFQCIKRYQVGAFLHDRVITRLVTGTLRVWLDAVEQTITTEYTVDLNTGIITMVTAPLGGEVVSYLAEFDVPVRFDIDRLNVNVETFEAGTLPAIPLVELREGP